MNVRTLATVAIAFTALLAMPGVLAQAHDSGARYLLADGTLAEASGQAQACPTLQLSATSASTASATFTGSLANTSIILANQTATLRLAVAPNASPGTGIRVAASLKVGDHEATTAEQDLAAGATLNGPIVLPLGVPSGETVANVTVQVQLTKLGTGPLAAGQSLTIQCNTEGTRLDSLPYTLPTTSEPNEPPTDDGPKGHISIPNVLGIAALAGLTTLVAGALVLSGRSISQRRIHLLLGATAGLLLAIALLDLVPEAVEINQYAPYTIVGGLLVLFLVRHFAGEHGHDHGGHGHEHHEHDGHGHAEHTATHKAGLAAIAFFALGFHRFVDGLVLPAAFEAGNGVGLAAASAVLIHQFPDGVAAASLFLAAGWHRRKVLIGVVVMAVLTPIGSLAGLLLLGQENLVGHLIALAAATFLFISLAELLPELRAKEHRMRVALGFVIGTAVALVVVVIPALVGVEV